MSGTGPALIPATEVTRPDGSTFISRNPDAAVVARIYPRSRGFSVRSVAGEPTLTGFRVVQSYPEGGQS
jgi:hypothetical protein